VDAVGLSVLSGAHNYVFPEVRKLLNDKGLDDVLLFGGGIIPEDDIPGLKDAGAVAIFTPGTSTQQVIDFLQSNVRPRKAS